MNPLLLLFFLLSSSSSSTSSLNSDTLNQDKPLFDGDVLVSGGQTFALGFFSSPEHSFPRYLGIWFYRVSEQTVVWVANREAPLNDTSGRLAVDSNGYLNLYAGNNTSPIWSAKFTTTPGNDSVARLLDSGNFVVLQERSSGMVLWQSFDYPSDTLLPYMKLGFNRRTGLNWSVTPWKSDTDPGPGLVNYRIDPTGYPQLFLYKNHSVPSWRGGPWTGTRWSGVPEMTKNLVFNVSYVNDGNEVSIVFGVRNLSILSRMYVEESGVVKRVTWNGHSWNEFWSAPKELCDHYGACGPNGNCDPFKPDTFNCICLPGFEPKSNRDWLLRDGSGGCVRKPGAKSTCRSGEGFVKVANVKVPDTSTARVNMSLGLKACEEECLKNCTCEAYTSADERGIGCLRWYGDLVDTRSYSIGGGQDIYIRVEADVLAAYNHKQKGPFHNAGMKALLIVSVAVILFLVVFMAFCLIRRHKKARDRVEDKLSFYFDTTNPDDQKNGNVDLPFFHLSEIAAATNNFSDENKLGEGGFGSVYKGTYKGNEIAVKRLSKYSGQGGEEFKNEVELIAKLQHRNLVRILGCCVQGHEKMLVYEYLPNKSLDYFIFDEGKKASLDWPIRYNIICGIARGILYLHEDSRLRIIHRDLKASNVLLDVSMNPKISDFGMARIFGTDQNEANTNRVVGTYGYMSPEYAMQGMFSVKSDVYSFGVLLLETVAGRKISSYYEKTTPSSLIGYTWELWKEDRALDIVDSSLGNSYPVEDVLRCIHIGLLCVQESAADRPNMFDVVFMLCNIETIPPAPKKPAFVLKREYHSGSPLIGCSSTDGVYSVNGVTLTMLEVR